jgi:hypothetical protein
VSSVLVGSAYGVLELRAQQFDQGVDASLAKLAQLRQAFGQGIPPVTLPPVGGSLPGSPNAPRQLPGGLAPDIQKDEQAMLRYAQSLASAQKAQGDLSGAASTYRTVLGQLTPNTIEHNRATAQLASTEAALAKEVAGSGGAVDALGSKLAGLAGPAALATAALAAIPAAIDLAKLGAQADLVSTRFDSLSKTAGTTGDALLGALRKASGGQISNLNLELTANRAQLLGVAHDAQTFGQLMAIARDRAQNLGTTTQSAFDDIVTGVGRASPRILDNLGIIISEKDAYDAFAKSIGKNTDALDANEKKQAILKAVLDQGNATLKETGGAIEGAAAGQARLGASFDNLRAKAGSFIADGVAPTVNSLSDLLNGFDFTTESMATASIGAQNLGRQIAGLEPITGQQAKAQEAWTKSVLDWIAAREVQIGLANAPTPASSGSGGSFDLAAIQSSVVAQRAYADSLELTGVRARAAALADQQKADIDRVAAVDAQTHALSQQKLAEQAQRAAAALLAAGPAGARAAALLASSSSGIDTATAAYYRLAAAKQAALGAALQGQNAAELSGPLSEEAQLRAGNRAQQLADRTAGVTKAQADARAAEQARINQLLQTGTATQVVTERQKEYNAAVKQFGANSKQAIDAQTTLIEAQKAAEKTGRGRVSAAQSTALQLQNVEEDSQAQLLKAQREGLERLRDQQQDFDLHRARSQEDEARKIASLYAHGQRAAAEREKEDFARQQRRDREDFNISRQRTLRNNAESTGDISGSADRRSEQIGNRAALRGVRSGAAVDLGARATPAIGGSTAAAARQTVAQLTIQGVINLDGKQVASGIWPAIEVLVDNEMAVSLQQIGIPGAGQSAVGGAG